MSFLEKIKSVGPKLSSRKGKIIGLVMLLIGSFSAATVTTLAWFNLSTKESTIQMVTGDIDVEINKVSAYKYVYPYYKKSTEFIDYNARGTVKKYVLEDHVLTYAEQDQDPVDVDEITISSDDAVIGLDTKSQGTTTTTLNQASPTNIYVPANYVPDFRYYLVGDGLFSGVTSSWSIENAYAFAQRDNISTSTDNHAIMDNVVVSAGSSFALLEAVENVRIVGNVEEKYYTYNYFPVSSATANSPFKVRDADEDQRHVGDCTLCLRSGIYTFDYSGNQIALTLRTSDGGQRKDVSVIMNNSLDPTKITIDYAGSPVAQQQPINQYLPTAIYNQNTMLVLDIELNFKNINPVQASLKIERTKSVNNDNSISNLASTYNDTSAFQEDYSTLRASDFFNFYAKFTKTPYVDGDAIWDTEHGGMHVVGNSSFVKFTSAYQNYDREVSCPLTLKEQSDSLIVLPSQNNIYHCYIAIEYDYEHCIFFLDKNRLGKTYYLDRDFSFHFFGTQYRESQSQNSQSSEESQG